MRKVLKYIIHHTYRPFLQWYLSKERTYNYGDIKIAVKPNVFHPGFFYSSKFLLDYLRDAVELKGKKFLELGCGTALISIMAAKRGAEVSASDISLKAIENARFNAVENQVSIEFILSDLFDNIVHQDFDVIAINPPYYKGEIKTERDYAWYCGEDMEYFQKLFKQLSRFKHNKTHILMVLSDECDIEQIRECAEEYTIRLVQRHREKRGIEWNCIYQLTYNSRDIIS